MSDPQPIALTPRDIELLEVVEQTHQCGWDGAPASDRLPEAEAQALVSAELLSSEPMQLARSLGSEREFCTCYALTETARASLSLARANPGEQS